LVTPLRWAVVAAAVTGAALGSKLLFWLEDPRLTWQHLHDPNYLLGGKTIVGALAFGLITVELAKRYIGLRDSTGDLYAIPLALGIAIGRMGCFLTGLSDNTYGTPTNLPWAVNFGDNIPRHPTQLYEIALLLALMSSRSLGRQDGDFDFPSVSTDQIIGPGTNPASSSATSTPPPTA
jgi:phosphatidylglycerol---prolipoprotein diacylglyceryl transferase